MLAYLKDKSIYIKMYLKYQTYSLYRIVGRIYTALLQLLMHCVHHFNIANGKCIVLVLISLCIYVMYTAG